MNRRFMIPLLMLISVVAVFGMASQCEGVVEDVVTVYPFAEAFDSFDDMSVRVHDKDGVHDIKLYAVDTNPKRQYPAYAPYFKMAAVAMFDMTGTVTLEVTYPAGIESVAVRPARAEIDYTVNGDTVTFQIKEWGQYTVEFNDDPETDALMIFANPPSVIPKDARVIEGRHLGNLIIEEGETVYLAPGSIVIGKVIMNNNSSLLGRGIVARSGPPTIQVWNCDNITIEGISIFNPSRWVVEFQNSTNITVENIKVISARNNGDGITIQSSSGITVNKSFIRSWDDNVVLKNYTKNNTFDIKVTNCVMWTDLAQTLEIGFETNKGAPGGRRPSPNEDPRIYNVLFENIDILHNFHKAPISIHNADGCLIYDVTFRNIIVENAQMGVPGNFGEGGGWQYLIDFGNGISSSIGGAAEWTWNDGYREIKDILVENVWVLGGEKSSCGARFINRDSGDYTSVMENIILRNIYFGQESLDYTSQIDSSGLPPGNIIQENAPYFHWDD